LALVSALLLPSTKGRAKFFSAKILRNPLKSLNSDERIQGNPSFSNPQKQGFSRSKGHDPRKPKRIDRTHGCGRRAGDAPPV